MENKELVAKALEARSVAYTPYSGFRVGAALLCADGTVYGGCNIENAAFGPSCCAERTAFFKAVSEGKREFSAIAIVGGPAGKEPEDFCPPCGVCRQLLSEFSPDGSLEVIAVDENGRWESATLAQLLPRAFGKHSIRCDSL